MYFIMYLIMWYVSTRNEAGQVTHYCLGTKYYKHESLYEAEASLCVAVKDPTLVG